MKVVKNYVFECPTLWNATLQQQPFSLTFMFLTFSKYIDFSNVFLTFSKKNQTFRVKIVRKINTFSQLFVTFDVKNVRKSNVFLRQKLTDFPHLVPSRSPNLPFFPSFHFFLFYLIFGFKLRTRTPASLQSRGWVGE